MYYFPFSFCPTDSSLQTVLARINNKLTGQPLKETIDPTDILNVAMAIYKNHRFDETPSEDQLHWSTSHRHGWTLIKCLQNLQISTTTPGFANCLRVHPLDWFQCTMPE